MDLEKQKILIVDDDVSNIAIINDALQNDYITHFATNAKKALEIALEIKPDLILLDVVMPDMDGYELFRRLKKEPSLKDVSVIFVTAVDSKAGETIGLKLGAIDYITKPINQNIVKLRVKNHLALKRQMLIEQQLILKVKLAEGANMAKTAFLSNMGHEFRTPMNVIMGFTDLVLDTSLDVEQREHLTKVKEASNHLLNLINGILDYSKMEAGKMKAADVDFDLLSTINITVAPFMAQALDRGIKLNIEISPNLPALLKGDVGMLKQVLSILIENALKFTKSGNIMVKAGIASLTSDNRTLSDKETRLMFSVSDTGIGIPKEKFDEIFESFTQGEDFMTKRYGGTGLGLSKVKKILNMLGGDIWVESEVGKGSTFYFTAKFLLQQKPVPTSLRSEETDVRNYRIMVVDSNPSAMFGLAEMVMTDRFDVDMAPDGQSALSMLNTAKPGYDVVIVDFMHNDMEGFELVKKIKATTVSPVKIIMILSAGLRGNGARCRELGISGYIVRPVYKSDLMGILNMVIVSGENSSLQFLTRQTMRELRGHINILVAENNAANQSLTVRLLEKRGYSPVTVGNGHEAVDILAKTQFDLVVMGLQMPFMDGLEATRLIRNTKDTKINAGIPIIAVTAHAREEDMARCLAAGMDDYISKPVKVEDFFRLIEKYTDSRQMSASG